MSTADPLAGIPCRFETVESYSGLDSETVPVLRPTDEAQLRRIFEHVRNAPLPGEVTLRSGGHSFDAQSLNSRLIVSMEGLDDICVDRARLRVTVGPGATWGEIVRLLQKRGLAPAVTVTTSHATAGGTLAGNCLSRFSPCYGKEGRCVESFELLTIEGRKLTCTPPPAGVPWDELTEEQQVFLGAIGGLGWLGAFVSITYKVLDVGATDGRIGVRTSVRKCLSFEELASRLQPAATHMERAGGHPRNPAMDDAIYAVLAPGRSNQEAVLFTSSYTDSTARRPLVLFQPDRWFRVPVELLVRSKLFRRALWWLSFSTRAGFDEDRPYIDDLLGYTFFLDSNVRAKQAARRWGVRLKTIQQTFVVPVDPEDPERLVRWLHHAQDFLDERCLSPTMVDVLYLPKDLPFPLSATSDQAGFAVSYAFETSRKGELDRIAQAFSRLADTLDERYDGRVYLVKNVRASKETLRMMYGEQEDFFALKAKLDPHAILCNQFLERTLGCSRPTP